MRIFATIYPSQEKMIILLPRQVTTATPSFFKTRPSRRVMPRGILNFFSGAASEASGFFVMEIQVPRTDTFIAGNLTALLYIRFAVACAAFASEK